MGGKNSELSSFLFHFPLLVSCYPLPYYFSFFCFFQMSFMIFFLPLPTASLPLFWLSLTSQRFSPDRFHSVLEGMDLIALWGLVGCGGLGCLISLPCRDWFNASWSWNCLIVQPSGEPGCLRRTAGLAKHCSGLLLYAAGRRYALWGRIWRKGSANVTSWWTSMLLLLITCRISQQTW